MMKQPMKKRFCIAALIALWLPATTLAEGNAVAIDWTPLVVAVIGVAGTAASALLARIWARHVRPWLEARNLSDAAIIVVDAVEAILGRYCGEDKWALALEKMRERGFDLDSDAVLDALYAAWKQLDLAQQAAGEKGAAAAGNGG